MTSVPPAKAGVRSPPCSICRTSWISGSGSISSKLSHYRISSGAIRMDEWVGIGGLFLAALTVVLSFLDRRHTRSESLRMSVYERQFDAIADVSKALAALQDSVGTWTNSGSDEARAERHVDAVKAMASLMGTAFRYRAVLPARTLSAIDRLVGRTVLLSRSEVSLSDWYRDLNAVYDEARKDMGVDRLSDRIRQLTGVAADEQSEAMVQSYRAADEILARDAEKRRSRRGS